jgi:hypothetical protein
MKKYVLHDGFVTSATDGQSHYIGPAVLARLYGVGMDDCCVYPSASHKRFGWSDPPGAIHLFPRYDGDYALPAA